jgi:hypothetical protein
MPEKELKPRRLDIFIADVRQISGCSDATASRKIALCRDALDKQQHQRLTIREYCTYYGYDYAEILHLLKLISKK